MIGGALGEARGDLMPGFVDAALKTPYKLRVPLAPAEGLVLESQVRASFCAGQGCLRCNSTRGIAVVDPSIVPVCASRKYWHYSGGNRHHSAYGHYALFPFVPSDFTGSMAGNRHYRGAATASKGYTRVRLYTQRLCKSYRGAMQGLPKS